MRLDLAQTHGLHGFLSLGHTHAISVPPPVGGLFLDQDAVDAISGDPFLIDHDQKMQAQGQLFLDLGKSGVWLGGNVRYDSGLVTDADPAVLAEDPDNAFAARCIELGTIFTAVGVDVGLLARGTEKLAQQFRKP